MHGWKCFLVLSLVLSACGSQSLLTADCHSCVNEEPKWTEFAWENLPGKWRGSFEQTRQARGETKTDRKTRTVQLQFVPLREVVPSGLSCSDLPKDSVAAKGVLWDSGAANRVNEFDVFFPSAEGTIAYGRLSFHKINGEGVCEMRRFGRVMGKNRLDLPKVAFSAESSPGRGLAQTSEREVSFEFLRFVPGTTQEIGSDQRAPASSEVAGKPQLMMRTTQVQTQDNGKQWMQSEEGIYRLWRVK
jgi:hypothetical protein